MTNIIIMQPAHHQQVHNYSIFAEKNFSWCNDFYGVLGKGKFLNYLTPILQSSKLPATLKFSNFKFESAYNQRKILWSFDHRLACNTVCLLETNP